jgi:hypothetical protein
MEETESEEEMRSGEESSEESKAEGGDGSEGEESDEDVEKASIYEFMSQLRDLLNLKNISSKLKLTGDEEDKNIAEQYVLDAVNVIKSFDRLENLNIHLLALASCFDIVYKTKDKVNEKNVTEFIKQATGSGIEPIDIIRYIIMYQANKRVV